MLPSDKEYIAFGSVDYATASQAVQNVIHQIDAEVQADLHNANPQRTKGTDTIVEVQVNKAWACSTWNHLVDRLKPVLDSKAVRIVENMAA